MSDQPALSRLGEGVEGALRASLLDPDLTELLRREYRHPQRAEARVTEVRDHDFHSMKRRRGNSPPRRRAFCGWVIRCS
jgi:hypothetical protein